MTLRQTPDSVQLALPCPDSTPDVCRLPVGRARLLGAFFIVHLLIQNVKHLLDTAKLCQHIADTFHPLEEDSALSVPVRDARLHSAGGAKIRQTDCPSIVRQAEFQMMRTPRVTHGSRAKKSTAQKMCRAGRTAEGDRLLDSHVSPCGAFPVSRPQCLQNSSRLPGCKFKPDVTVSPVRFVNRRRCTSQLSAKQGCYALAHGRRFIPADRQSQRQRTVRLPRFRPEQ